MQPSQQCYELIKSFEGLFLRAYPDSVGKTTIGYGTIRYPNGRYVSPHDMCTKEQAEEWLDCEIKEKSLGINHLTQGIELTQNQHDALISFCYNLGLDALHNSDLLKKMRINPNDETIYKYDHDGAKQPIKNSCEFLRWIYAGHHPLNGLIKRRAAEADLYGKK
jgi:lysozyme